DLRAYKRNPVVLWGHDSSRTPIGSGRVWREGKALMGAVRFAPSIMGNHVAELVQAKMLHATSVGFVPLKFTPAKGPGREYGIDFHEQELLEFSVVSVPANPEALIVSASLNNGKSARQRDIERRNRTLAAIRLRASR